MCRVRGVGCKVRGVRCKNFGKERRVGVQDGRLVWRCGGGGGAGDGAGEEAINEAADSQIFTYPRKRKD